MTTQNWHDSRIAPPHTPDIERKQLYLPDTKKANQSKSDAPQP
jgi:hypothetical protein